jgi:hypothetical protein
MNVGQMAARVDRWCDYPDHSKIDYYANEPGTFMIIVMLTPQPVLLLRLFLAILPVVPVLIWMVFRPESLCRMLLTTPNRFQTVLSIFLPIRRLDDLILWMLRLSLLLNLRPVR